MQTVWSNEGYFSLLVDIYGRVANAIDELNMLFPKRLFEIVERRRVRLYLFVERVFVHAVLTLELW